MKERIKKLRTQSLDAVPIISEERAVLLTEFYKSGLPEKKPMVGKESFCIWRNGNDYNINWNWGAERIKRFVDAVGYPFDGAKAIYDGHILRVNECEVLSYNDKAKIVDRENHIGKILHMKNNKPVIICGDGLIKLTDVDKNKEEFKFYSIKVKL